MKNSLFESKKYLTPQYIYPFGLFVVFFVLYTQSFNFRGYSDQFYYATDIETGRAIRWADPGHLFYSPLGWLIYKFFQTFGYTGRAVTILQFESAFFGAIGVMGFFHLIYNIVKDIRIAIFSASMLAFSHSYWYFSGNGTSYLPSTAVMIFAFILLFKLSEFLKYQSARALHTDRQKTLLYVLAISLISALSALFWLPQVLCFPAIALGIILIPQRLNYSKRFALAFTYSIGVLLFLIVPIVLGLIFINECKSFGDLLIALKSTSHGVPLKLSILNFLRIFYGVAFTFVAIPDMGSTVRGLITGDFNLVGPKLILETGKFFAVWTVYLLTISYLVVKWKTIEKSLKIVLLILGVWILPFLCFGIIWKGADLERLLPALPAAILAASITISHLQPLKLKLAKTISIVIIAVLPICNFSGFFIPARNIVNDKDWKIAKSLEQKINPNDLVITWGLDMTSVGNFLFYYAHRHCINLNLDIVLSGSMGWDERLAKNIKNSRANGGKVFIHNRLIIEKDVPESRWSKSEFPHPDRQELRTFFLQYRKTLAWIIEDEIFWEVQSS
ncbi:MAG: hypothetical protein ACUZ77_02105 [Candidatus Brocadiales bacterium]